MEEYANEIIQEEEIYSNPEFQRGLLKGFKKAEKVYKSLIEELEADFNELSNKYIKLWKE